MKSKAKLLPRRAEEAENPTPGAESPSAAPDRDAGEAHGDAESGLSLSFVPPEGQGLDPITSARYEDIARRALQLQNRTEIAQAHGISSRTLRRVFADPRFGLIYERTKDLLYGNVDGMIADEKAHVSLRKTALQARQITLLGEVMEAVRDHMKKHKEEEGTAANVKSTMLRAGVEAAREVSNLNRDQQGGGGNTQAVQVNITVPQHAAKTMADAAAESGVDVSDLFDKDDAVDV